MDKADEVNSDLKSLIELQGLNLRIKALKDRILLIPGEIAALRGGIDECQARLESATSQLDGHERERRHWEGDVERLRERLSKYKTQLMEVKTNREYQAVLQEIAVTEREISETEDRILEAMLDADEKTAMAREAEQILTETSAEATARCRELELGEKQAEEEVHQLVRMRDSLIAELPQELRDLYDRIAVARAGTALAEARDQSCQVCHVKLRPQLFNEIKQNRRIITCENCSRILYYVEN